jgi:hypothetical protein
MVERIELSKEAIAQRAYELFLQRGGEQGKDVEDWVRAEKELSSQVVIGSGRAKTASVGRSNPN